MAAVHHHCRTLWLSDLHLGSRDCHAEALLDLLTHVRADTLYLVGDVGDLWAMRRQVYWPASHQAVIQQLHLLAQRGTRVVYIPGNHDAALRDFAPSPLFGFTLEQQAVHTTVDGRRLLIVHGDQFDGAVSCGRLTEWIGDKGYEALLYLNRHLNRLRARWGLGYWSLAGYVKQQVSGAQVAIRRYEQAAIHEARKRGVDGIICGHIHVARLVEDNGVLYANTGDWVENCTILMEHHTGALRLLSVHDGHSVEVPAAVGEAA